MKSYLTLIALAALACESPAAVFTLSPSADAFVRASAPTLNFGGAGSLSVSGAAATNGLGFSNGAFDSFMRFNTATMVANFNSQFGTGNWVINGATLRVTEMGAPANTNFNRGTGSFEIRWIAADAWTEGTGMPQTPTTNGIAYTNESGLLNPGTDATLGTFTNTGTDVALSLSLALPAALVADIQAGGEVGFFMTALDPGTGFSFNSRSFMTNSARPVLDISALPVPGITAINLSGNDVVFTCTNGASGGTYHILSTTNIGLPLGQWIPSTTNILVANGNFSITATNAADLGAPSPQFFILQTR